MRLGTTLIALVAAASAASAFAASTAKDPMSLILRKADFPAGAAYEANDGDYTNFKYRLESGGVSFEPATFQGNSYSRAKGSLQVSGTVFVTASVAQARKGFALMKSRREAYWIGSDSVLSLPSYGDQQYARLSPAGAEGLWLAAMIVRKRATLWAMKVVVERRPAISKSEFLASVNTYARKFRARVGKG